MELIPKSSPEYFLIKKEYDSVITNITREKKYDKFIGGLPITIERKDMFTIISKDMDKNYRYSITQKVDGTRVLLFANFKTEDSTRNICFIDRNNDFYILKNYMRESLPTFNGPKLLIDGELVCFNKQNEIVSPTEKYYDIKSFSFMSFDILYGPISIEYEGPPYNKKLNIGSEGAFCGPIGGKSWNYNRRYDILYSLLVPNERNNNTPLLSLAFKDISWFVPEIKPLYFINNLKTAKKIYSEGDGFFQKSLVDYRKKYYNNINKLREENGSIKKAEYINISLDGLIFTPFNTEYVIGGVWKKFLNIQFKWKPVSHQSIDFQILNQKGSNESILQVQRQGKLTTFTTKIKGKIKPATTLNKLNNLNGKIAEFSYNNKTNKFELLNIRKDKTMPNSLTTALNVMNAVKYPIDLNIIKSFFIIEKLNEIGLKNVMQYLTKNQLIRCSLENKSIKLFDNDTHNKLIEQINEHQTNNAYELEIRLGFIESDKFQTKLPFNMYKQIIDILSYNNIKWTYSVYMDMFKGDIRSRYLHLQDLNSYIIVGNIKKETLKNVSIDTKYIYNIDLRFSLSNEKETDTKITNDNAELILIKKRYSFNVGHISIDCTEVSNYDKITKKETTHNYLVEFEILDRKSKSDIVLDNTINLIRQILNSMND